VRLIVWSIILILMVVQRSKKMARQNLFAKETRETA
jgi:hypothetical protein